MILIASTVFISFAAYFLFVANRRNKQAFEQFGRAEKIADEIESTIKRAYKWKHFFKDGFPEKGRTVLLSMDNGQVLIGTYQDGRTWIVNDTLLADEPENIVLIAWTELPIAAPKLVEN